VGSTAKYDRPEGYKAGEGYPWSSDTQLLSWIPASSRVLELGCATGYMGRHLKETKNCRVTGVEGDLTSVNQAKGSYEKLVHADLDKPDALSSVEGPFDVILCAAILEHLKNPDQLLTVLREKLSPSGSLIVSLPNVAHWSVRWQLLTGRFTYTPYGLLDTTHVRFFTYSSAQDLIRNAGFTIERVAIDPDAGIPLVNGLIRRLPGGWAFLKWVYNLRPNFFGYQVLIEARIS
jgi:methionine biosynthesis protein MetW